jgi:hypothetical protein
MRAHRFGIEAGEAETTVEISLLIPGLNDFWIDQGQKRPALASPISSPTA